MMMQKTCLLGAVWALSGPLLAQAPAGPVPVTRTRFNHKQYEGETPADRWMSSMGRIGRRWAEGLSVPAGARPNGLWPRLSDDLCSSFDNCGEDASDSPSGTHSETAIAIDPTGQHIVIGFNDFHGFTLNPVSDSGFAYSDDGGLTFTYGGQLPVTSDGQLQNGTKFPQVLGDPDVKFVPGGNGCQFVYSSLFNVGFGTAPNYTNATGTLAIHRSRDCGHTWEGPFEIGPATNPNGQLVGGARALDSADKEFIDVDPDTGRVMVTWSNFTTSAFRRGGVEISSTYSDDVMSGNPPTWSSRVVINLAGLPGGAQASVPRFAGGSDYVYVAYIGGNLGVDIYVAASPNNGLSFAAPVRLNPAPFIPMDYALGNDRPGNSPSLAVDRSPGLNRGNVYVVYCTNNNGDGCDIAFQRSTDLGATFSPPVLLNSNPGFDRPQWFPCVTVDSQTGRVSVIYYDQGIASSGDLTELTWTYSDDGGATWSKPSPLSPRPFHAAYGNDTSQPNLGDYIAAVAQNGTLYAAYAATPSLALFTDGQAPAPDGNLWPYPNVAVQKGVIGQLPVRLGTVTFTESGGNGFIDAGDEVRLHLPLSSYVLNPLHHPAPLAGITATLSTLTPNVTVTTASAAYNPIAAGATVSNTQDFVVKLARDFVPGTKIEFSLKVNGPQAAATLLFTLNTGTPVEQVIFAEDFDSTAPGSLPQGWTTIHVGPTPPQNVTPVPAGYIVPWTTDAGFCGATSNGLFHINANDGPVPAQGAVNHSRYESILSPRITIPADSQYVTLDFDICYDTEDDFEFPLTDYDGATLRIVDLTSGRTPRTALAEAFAEWIHTGDLFHFPKHFPRSGAANYFADMSNWGGDSGGFRHVSMRFNGMEGSAFMLRWDYTQDAALTCADLRFFHTCGVIVDNVVMRSYTSQSSELANVTLRPVEGAANRYSGTVELQAIAPAKGLAVRLESNLPRQTRMPESVTVPAGATQSEPFPVTIDAPASQAGVTIRASGPSNSRSAAIRAH